ncbi:PH domain-containing protein [Candidatus Berkelbacteria bacterium]|nr:PH domain-containing protein [Candidatus Berkelbacteria bacterium]MBI4029979.1 PH domain-containing protein [Candidatus Berkelbacteria bacterium]
MHLKNVFPGQDPDEKIYVFLRRHFLSFVWVVLLFLVIWGLVLTVLYFLTSSFEDSVLTGAGRNIFLLSSSAAFLFLAAVFMVAWIDFYFDLHIVTDRRVVDINQNALFNRDQAELNLEDIEDVKAVVRGVLGTVFDFGDVEIQTAGTQRNFLFEKVAHPREVAQIITDLRNDTRRGVPVSRRYPDHEVVGVVDNKMLNRHEMPPVFEEGNDS